MPSATAARLCAELIFVRPRFDAYKEASRQVRAIFARYTFWCSRFRWMKPIWM